MKLLCTMLFTFSLWLIMNLNISVLAAEVDLDSGSQIFSANCVACHSGGQNLVNPLKTLKKDDLEKFKMNDIPSIVTQVNNGKNSMPSFSGRLNDEEILNVASYVLDQSQSGW